MRLRKLVVFAMFLSLLVTLAGCLNFARHYGDQACGLEPLDGRTGIHDIATPGLQLLSGKSKSAGSQLTGNAVVASVNPVKPATASYQPTTASAYYRNSTSRPLWLVNQSLLI